MPAKILSLNCRAAAKGGFTIFEALLTVILVAGGFSFLLQVIGRGLFTAGDNESHLVAINLAREKMEEIKNKGYSNITDEGKAAVSGFPAFQRQVSVTTPSGGLKQVSVNVYWFNKADELSEGLVTYVSDI